MNNSQQNLYLSVHMLFLTRGGLKQMAKKGIKIEEVSHEGGCADLGHCLLFFFVVFQKIFTLRHEDLL